MLYVYYVLLTLYCILDARNLCHPIEKKGEFIRKFWQRYPICLINSLNELQDTKKRIR